MNLLHRVSCFYSPKARRIASSSSNVILAGRFLFFFLGFSKAFLIPYLAPLLTALDTRALPAIKIRGMIPPRWWVRRRVVVRLRLRRGTIPLRHRPHMVLGQSKEGPLVFISFCSRASTSSTGSATATATTSAGWCRGWTGAGRSCGRAAYRRSASLFIYGGHRIGMRNIANTSPSRPFLGIFVQQIQPSP